MVPMIASVQVMPNSSGPAPPYAGIMMECEQQYAEEVDNEEKKRMKQLGDVELPQDAFLAILKIDED